MDPRIALTLAAATSAALAVAGAAVAVLPAAGASGAATDVPNCEAGNLYVARGRIDAAAGNRYLPIRVTNVGDTLCALPTTTKVRFRDFHGALGIASLPPATSSLATLQPGDTVSTVVHWVDPGPVPPAQCLAAEATLVTLGLPALGHTWRLPLKASVCTTTQYRPDATALKP